MIMIQRKDGNMAEKSKKYEANAQFGKLQRAHDAKRLSTICRSGLDPNSSRYPCTTGSFRHAIVFLSPA